jgi:hypothetical protein
MPQSEILKREFNNLRGQATSDCGGVKNLICLSIRVTKNIIVLLIREEKAQMITFSMKMKY